MRELASRELNFGDLVLIYTSKLTNVIYGIMVGSDMVYISNSVLTLDSDAICILIDKPTDKEKEIKLELLSSCDTFIKDFGTKRKFSEGDIYRHLHDGCLYLCLGNAYVYSHSYAKNKQDIVSAQDGLLFLRISNKGSKNYVMTCLDTPIKPIDFGSLIYRCRPTSRTILLASKAMFTKLANTCNLTERIGYCDVQKYKRNVGGADVLVYDYANTKNMDSGKIMLVYQKLNNRDALSLLNSVI